MKLLDDSEDTELIVARDLASLVAYREAWLEAAKELANEVEYIQVLEQEITQTRLRIKEIIKRVEQMAG